MKTFASPSFFRTFDLLLGIGNPGSKLTCWMVDGVEWRRDRYTVTGHSHGFAIEIVTLTRGGRRGWSLMVTKEYWWAGAGSEAIKSLRWARPVNGRRKDILEWFRKQEADMDNRAGSVQPGNSSSRFLAEKAIR